LSHAEYSDRLEPGFIGAKRAAAKKLFVNSPSATPAAVDNIIKLAVL
jgi:hypothetical protein